MRYMQECTLGKPLKIVMRPWQRIVNNGYIIQAQDGELLWQLHQDERLKDSEPIDWHLFKDGNTILIDNYKRKFACIGQSKTHVQLAEMCSDLIILTKDENGDRHYLQFPTAEDFVHDIGTENNSIDSYEVLYAEWKEKIIYSSLYLMAAQNRTNILRISDLYEWLKSCLRQW